SDLRGPGKPSDTYQTFGMERGKDDPFLRGCLGHDFEGPGLAPIIVPGLQLDVHGEADRLQHLAQGRHTLAGICPVEPRPRVEPPDLAERACDHLPTSAGRASERPVVDHYAFAIR